ncbi:hypothetical protein COB57_04505 [Candidatus Peregrinibacteria bacterium]|nr:MAG: hypothetical protein COB57_04505 [Candidatus Peregrinibacteria bacterium]
MRYLLSFLLVFFMQTAGVLAASNYLYVTSEGEIILNGESLGYGENPVVDNRHYAYETMKSDGVHVIYDGKDMGKGHSPQIDEGRILFERVDNLRNTIIVDGVSYGEGYAPELQDKHFIYFKKIHNNNLQNKAQGRVFVFYDGKYYCDGEESEIRKKIDFSGNNVICEQTVSLKGAEEKYVVFNGIVIDTGYDVFVSPKHFSYTKEKEYGKEKIDVLMVDGVEIGEGYDFAFSDDSFIFKRKNFEGGEELFFNGKNIGSFVADSLTFQDGQVAFIRKEKIEEKNTLGVFVEKEYDYVYYNGVKRGRGDISTVLKTGGKKIFLSNDHIAFERKLIELEYPEAVEDADLQIQEIGRAPVDPVETDISYVVFDGRERTSIVEGSLRMDEDGYFGFAKEVELKKEDEAYARVRYLYYKDKKYGDDAAKDTLYSDLKKYTYTKTPFIYRGIPDGSVRRLGEGDVKSIVVQDGNVAYTKEENVIETYYTQEEKKRRLKKVRYLYINGGNKGEGDIDTLIMDHGQYAFARNVKGRFFLVINGKQQTFPGKEVAFLGSGQKTVLTPALSKTQIKIQKTGRLFSIKDKNYLKLDNKEGVVQMIFAKSVDVNRFMRKRLTYTIKESNGTFNKAVSIRQYLVYGVTAVKVQTVKTVVTRSEFIEVSGVLTEKDGNYSLRTSKKLYELRLSGGVEREDLNSWVNDQVTLKLKEESFYGNARWAIQKIIQ